MASSMLSASTACSRIRLRKPSTCALQPGGMTVVASNCSTIAGPSIVAPTSRRSRSYSVASDRAAAVEIDHALALAGARGGARRRGRRLLARYVFRHARRARAADSSPPRPAAPWRNGRGSARGARRSARARRRAPPRPGRPHRARRAACAARSPGRRSAGRARAGSGPRPRSCPRSASSSRAFASSSAIDRLRMGGVDLGERARAPSGCSRAPRRCTAGRAPRTRPGRAGTRMRRMPSSSATAAACTAPAPPNGSSVKAERSTPRLAANTRTSSAMRMSTMRRMPAAASRTARPSGSAISIFSAASAAATSSRCAPPRK